MEFRKAIENDIIEIIKIIKQAQEYFKSNEIDQWQNNYPNLDTIKNDIKNNYGHVLVENSRIVGTVSVSFDGEKTYEEIYGGQWLSNNKYAVIHRRAIDNEYKRGGLSSVIIKHLEELCLDNDIHSIKVDTHIKNIPMQKLLKKNNYQYCGIIYLDDKSERVAFEKLF